MKKSICLFASIFYGFMSLAIPYMFLMFTNPTGVNLTCMSILFAISVMGCYAYADTYRELKSKKH
jgi:hypothetical protein